MSAAAYKVVTKTLDALARRVGLRVREEFVADGGERYVVRDAQTDRRLYDDASNEAVAAFLGRYAQVNGHRRSER